MILTCFVQKSLVIKFWFVCVWVYVCVCVCVCVCGRVFVLGGIHPAEKTSHQAQKTTIYVSVCKNLLKTCENKKWLAPTGFAIFLEKLGVLCWVMILTIDKNCTQQYCSNFAFPTFIQPTASKTIEISHFFCFSSYLSIETLIKWSYKGY